MNFIQTREHGFLWYHVRMAYIVAMLMSVLGVIGDYFLRMGGSGPRYVDWRLFGVGIFVYALTAVGWFYAFKHMKLAMVGVIYSLTTIVLLTLLGTFYFGERLTLVEGAGLAFAVIALLMLARFG